MTSTSNKRSIDDLDLEECCRSIKRLAVSLRGEGATGAGDKNTPSCPKVKKKPWRVQMQPKLSPKTKPDQKICSPLKNLEDQISLMLKSIRYSIPSITGKEATDPVDVSGNSLQIKKNKRHARQSRRKPYQKSRPDNAQDKDPAKDNPMITPSVNGPVNKKQRQGTSGKQIPPTLVPKAIITAPDASEFALPTKDKETTDKASYRKRKQKICNIPNKKRKVNKSEDGVIKDLIRKFAQLAI
ncbi:uncharacterized protein LOC128165007 [Crassostrea angulata]|uniref:uncharacterized protein n=1 Tax=Magallana gigas TaxID=29159 RepID=UPI0022B13CF3|nr:uncharacterized protein LOC128165007 [Crassostrea angulata]